MSRILDCAKQVIDVEIEGLQQLRGELDSSFEEVCSVCLDTVNKGGKLILTGIGKSGYIAKKIAATLSSIGSPAVFLHPIEALHGDLGIMQKFDLMLAVSYSGETEELTGVIAPAKRLGVKVVAVTGNASSSLAKLCDYILPMPIPREACPFNLAPTASTTALLALGDALAMVMLQERKFTRENYGRLHPGGAIGRAVTLRAADVMRTKDRSAVVLPETPVEEVLLAMTEARCGAAIVADADRKLLGIFTDGDFRRCAKKDMGVLQRKICDVMTRNPVYVHTTDLAAEVLKQVEDRHINGVIVLDDRDRVAGLIDVQDLPGLKLL